MTASQHTCVDCSAGHCQIVTNIDAQNTDKTKADKTSIVQDTAQLTPTNIMLMPNGPNGLRGCDCIARPVLSCTRIRLGFGQLRWLACVYNGAAEQG